MVEWAEPPLPTQREQGGAWKGVGSQSDGILTAGLSWFSAPASLAPSAETREWVRVRVSMGLVLSVWLSALAEVLLDGHCFLCRTSPLTSEGTSYGLVRVPAWALGHSCTIYAFIPELSLLGLHKGGREGQREKQAFRAIRWLCRPPRHSQGYPAVTQGQGW